MIPLKSITILLFGINQLSLFVMPIVHYPSGCKCAYCRQNIEDSHFKREEKRYVTTSTSKLGNRCTYSEWTVEIPTCEECGKRRGRIEKPIFALGCIFSLLSIVIAFVIAFRNGDGFWQGLIYCIPAIGVSGLVILVINFIGQALNNKKNGALSYAPLILMKKYGFKTTKPGTQQIGGYYSNWDKVSSDFYKELAEVERNLRAGIFDYKK